MQEVFNLIKQQVEDQQIHEVEQLILDECHFKSFTPLLKKEIEKYENLLYLSLNDCQLKNLDNFPMIPHLLKLDLLDNQLQDDSLALIAKNKNLQQISLGGNNIKQIDQIKVFQNLKDLREVDLQQCPLTNSEDYREKVFSLLEQIEILDNMDKDGNILESDEVSIQLQNDSDDSDENSNDAGKQFKIRKRRGVR